MRRSQTFTSTVAEVARMYLMLVENGANLMTEVATKGRPAETFTASTSYIGTRSLSDIAFVTRRRRC